MSLRRTFTIVTILLTILALASAISTVLLTNYLDNTVTLLRENLESVRIGQEIEIDLLEFSRSTNPKVWQRLEGELREEIARAQQFVGTDLERSSLSDTASSVNRIFQLRSEGAANTEIRDLVERALANLRQFVDINISQAHATENDVAAVNLIAERMAIVIAVILVLCVAAVLIWIGWFAFRPVFGIGDTMKAFAAGDRKARAPEIGTQELRTIAQQFNEMADHLARQRENQLAFLTSVAHDLRNPIGALKMATAILDPDGPLPREERVREILGVVKRQIDHLNRMIGDLLDAYHIQSGNLELRMQVVDASDLVRDAFELFRYVSSVHQLSLQLPPTHVPLQCDPLRLSQVLNNLLSNAIKYSPDGGNIVIGLEARGSQVVIEVSDAGMGIAPEELPHIFEPFRRTRLASRDIPGIGLGLHVVQRIIQAHGGQIEAQSRVGQGTTFKFSIPSRVVTEQSRVIDKEHIA